LGGIFVAVLAPRLFSDYWEYELGLAASYGLVAYVVWRDMTRRVASVPAAKQKVKVKSKKRSGKGKRAGRQRKVARPSFSEGVWPPRLVAAAGFLGVAALLIGFASRVGSGNSVLISKTRNFYGVLRVNEVHAPYPRLHKRIMNHGAITHGSQYLSPERKLEATTYFGQTSGVGIAIDHHPKRANASRPFRIGVIGLGAGTLATYGNRVVPGPERVADHLKFYEIDARVVTVAEEHFSFLADARARGAEIEILVGDGRMLLEHELDRPQRFDVLVVDAFSGDAIPIHLLTEECASTYWAHLQPDGILAVHISNRYLDLRPVVERLAALHGKKSQLFRHSTRRHGKERNSWILASCNAEFLASEVVRSAAVASASRSDEGVLWTDDFSSLFDVLQD
jgi:hypothetical protein